MFPNVLAAFADWTQPVQFKLVNKKAVNHELVEEVLAVVPFDAVMQPLPPLKVDRKPEGLRQYKWWEVWSTTKIAPDSVVQDQNGLQFRVQTVQDWSNAGYFHYEMTEQPV